jgi:hypothetical protein
MAFNIFHSSVLIILVFSTWTKLSKGENHCTIYLYFSVVCTMATSELFNVFPREPAAAAMGIRKATIVILLLEGPRTS